MMISLAEFLLSVHWFSSGIKTMFFTSYDKDPDDPKPPIDNVAGVNLTPDGYKMHSVETDPGFGGETKPLEDNKSILVKVGTYLLDKLTEKPEKKDSTFCKVEAVVAVTGATLEVGYNAAFLFYIFMNVRYLNRKKLSTKFYHVAVLGFLLATILKQSGLLGGTVGFGRNAYGSCSVHYLSPTSLALGLTSMIVCISFSLIIIYYIRKVLPQHTRELASLKRDFANFYFTYLKLIIVLWSIVLFNFFTQALGHDDTTGRISANTIIQPDFKPPDYTFRGYLFLIGKLGNISKALTPILLFYVRLRDPLIKENIWYPFKGTIKKFKGEDELQFSKELVNELKSNTNDLMWINMLSSKIKESLHRTLLCAIGSFYPQLMKSR